MFTRQKKLAQYEVQIPEGVDVKVEGGKVWVKGEKGELFREFPTKHVEIELVGKELRVRSKTTRSEEKALAGTIAGHLRNMIKGVTEGFVYRLRVVYSHFPIKVSLRGSELLIENFLGERCPRRARILEGVEVEIKGKEIVLRGIDKERVSQSAANIEQATRIKDLDSRVFQDGIYIVQKGEKVLVEG